nr:cysteine-rich RLK (receptor-like protein kinase) 8 [Tanacetum cinerariifolium]
MLFGSVSNIEATALYSKGGTKDKCSIYGFKWNPPEKSWEKVGYPAWHPKAKGSPANRQVKTDQRQNRNQFAPRTATHVESGNISFTPQQFEQLMKSVQQMGVFNAAEEEIDHQFAACIVCLNSQINLLEMLKDWIYDTGLDNKKGRGLGRLKSGLYHLVKIPSEQVDSVFKKLVYNTMQTCALSVVNNVLNNDVSNSYALWHHRLCHVSDSKLKHIKELLVSISKECLGQCLSCPMAKFTKLPYDLSDSHSVYILDLIHIDIWGPYKVPTNGKFRYFLTIVDDCSRGT